MLKNTDQKKICNCENPSNKEILQSHINHSFCEKCGSILIKSVSGNVYYTIKPIKKQKEIELDPITIIKSMKIKTEENFPYIYNSYNNSDFYNNHKNEEKLNIYFKNRKMLILNLQKLIKKYDYSDMTFYQCLFYLDTFLRRDIHEKISKKTLLYNLVGYFLSSAKLVEKSILEPQLESFCNISNDIYLYPDKIAHYEDLCIKRMNYNIFCYSSYDWIEQFISNGIIFNSEINENNEIILINGHRHSLVKALNKYSIKLLLHFTTRSLFFKYSPMYIALSIIKLTREKFIDKSMIKHKLFRKLLDLYGVDFPKFKECYDELKSELNSENEINSKEEIKTNEESQKSQNITKEPERLSVDKIKKSFQSFINKKNNNISTESTEYKSSKQVTTLNNDITPNKNKKENYNINNINNIRNQNKIKLANINHLSIDCKKSSKDCIQKIKRKYLIGKNKLNPIITENNFASTLKQNRNNNNIDSFFENELENNKSRINIKYLTSKKISRIKADENKDNKNNQLEQIKESIHIYKNKKYAIKSDKNLCF